MGSEHKLDPAKLMVYEPREDGEWRRGLFFGAFRTPTPADLLTDPRVAALVEALRRETDGHPHPALAPFEEVSRGK